VSAARFAAVAWFAWRPLPAPGWFCGAWSCRSGGIVATAPEPEPPPAPAWSPGFLGARGAASTIVVWTEGELLVSRSDGRAFDPLEVPAPVTGADVDAAGTVFAVCADRLLVLGADGGMAWRPLPFGSWPDWPLSVTEVFADGGRVGLSPTYHRVTSDEGRSWRSSRSRRADYQQHAAVVGSTLITTRAATASRHGLHDRAPAPRRRASRVTSPRYAGSSGSGTRRRARALRQHLRQRGYAAGPFDQLVRAPAGTYAVRRRELVQRDSRQVSPRFPTTSSSRATATVIRSASTRPRRRAVAEGWRVIGLVTRQVHAPMLPGGETGAVPDCGGEIATGRVGSAPAGAVRTARSTCACLKQTATARAARART
jgi:hypothetical protein